MPRFVAFAKVDRFLKAHDYVLLRKRPYPGTIGAAYVVYGRVGVPLVGFPVVAGRVLDKHWERIRFVIELHNEED